MQPAISGRRYSKGHRASWRRSGRRRSGLPGLSRRTRPSFWRAARGSGSSGASRAGAVARQERGLSREQVPVMVAADRGGATLSHTLPALNADKCEGSAGADLRPGCPAGLRRQPLLSARRGGARHPSREHQRLCRRAGPGCRAHPAIRSPGVAVAARGAALPQKVLRAIRPALESAGFSAS